MFFSLSVPISVYVFDVLTFLASTYTITNKTIHYHLIIIELEISLNKFTELSINNMNDQKNFSYDELNTHILGCSK